ncbi:hypothetical protein EMPG_16220 [Blastomyces silverae]|uniref:Uncharacterized protein n=1 Tax=Blastomyces silverae TaxID=2060906 RepID=A0A0H1BAH1_9EURO|nr:hypothetical protein EMPG_16220 [Blastomyces silverae]
MAKFKELRCPVAWLKNGLLIDSYTQKLASTRLNPDTWKPTRLEQRRAIQYRQALCILFLERNGCSINLRLWDLSNSISVPLGEQAVFKGTITRSCPLVAPLGSDYFPSFSLKHVEFPAICPVNHAFVNPKRYPKKQPQKQIPWPRDKIYASFNNFRFGGSNAHVVLKKALPFPESGPAHDLKFKNDIHISAPKLAHMSKSYTPSSNYRGTTGLTDKSARNIPRAIQKRSMSTS